MACAVSNLRSSSALEADFVICRSRGLPCHQPLADSEAASTDCLPLASDCPWSPFSTDSDITQASSAAVAHYCHFLAATSVSLSAIVDIAFACQTAAATVPSTITTSPCATTTATASDSDIEYNHSPAESLLHSPHSTFCHWMAGSSKIVFANRLGTPAD